MFESILVLQVNGLFSINKRSTRSAVSRCLSVRLDQKCHRFVYFVDYFV